MKKLILAVLAVMLLILVIGAYLIIGPGTAFESTSHDLYIHTGMNYDELDSMLKKDEVIEHPALFKWLANRISYPVNMKAGKYEIRKGTSLLNMLKMLKNGRQLPVNLVITKLRTREDLAGLIGRKFECDSAQFMRYMNNTDTLSFYSLDTNTFMTMVFPNTYTYFWNTTAPRIFKKMEVAAEAYWTPTRLQEASARGLNRTTAYILASIVEEETTRKDDKPIIASVYLNRIRSGMRLSADPTVKFALRRFDLKRVYEKYLQVESPYNTYMNPGLPPGPICTPSMESLEAVLSAPTTRYLYFVAKPDFSGYSNFAETFPEHLKFAREYQKSLDEQMRIGQQSKGNP
ncbi:MAG TPA: endolytic transglycosylase MltG [Puia sp.]